MTSEAFAKGDRVAVTILGDRYEGVVELTGPVGSGVRTEDNVMRYVPNNELELLEHAPASE